MPDIVERRRNRAPWLAFLFTLIAIALNAWTFFTLKGTESAVWLSFAAGLCAVIFGLAGLGRAFGRSRIFGGKVPSVIFSVLALLVCGLMAFLWFHARALPASAGAPRVGQKAPDFTLPDTQGNQVSLAQLLAGTNSGDAQKAATPPAKAVLLIFYRGYW
jgi:hypothetical protein